MSTRKEKILQKLNPKLLKMTPKLSGDEGSFIDLDTDDSLVDGAKNLMMRFFRNQDLCEKNKRNLVQSVTELTISSAKRNDNNEICEIISERLSLPFTANDEDEACERPGKRLQKLKMELQEKMSAKWEEEYRKRVNENKVGFESKHKHQKKLSDDDDDDDGDGGGEHDSDDGVDNKDNSDESDDNNDNSDDESKSEKISEDDENDGARKNIDEENSDNEYEGDEEDCESDAASVASVEENNENNYEDKDKLEKDDEYDGGDGCSLVPAYQPGGGMLYGGSELTQTEDGLPQNLLSPSLRLSMNELSDSRVPSQGLCEGTPKKAVLSPNEEVDSSLIKSNNKLFSQAPNDSFDLNEAFEFCSGKFPDAESQSGSQLVSGNLVEENVEGNDYDVGDGCGSEDKFGSSFEEESEDDSQSKVEGLEKEITKGRRNIIAFEDSEGEEQEKVEEDLPLEDAEKSQSAGLELLSDDEEENTGGNVKIKKKTRKNLHFSDEEDAASDCEKEKDDESSDEEGVSEKEDVGDECEERSVHYDSEENEIINPREFFEKEAELSGEEWSGDEDERGLDEFDVEEGDADKLDDDKVRSQLEKIHIRRVLDDDAREVRLIQEILFEDGDLHSDGKRRDRKFKWKNLGAFDDQGNEGEAKEEGGNSSEDENAEEEQLRKIRHEKELFLMAKKKDGDLSSDEEIVEDFHTIKVTSVKTTIKLPGRNESVIESSKTITDYSAIAKTTSLSSARGSFLTRNEEFLSRLAKATSGVTDNVLGPKSSKNFVFATKSPEKTNPERTTACKRQVEDSSICGAGRDKKIKLLLPRIDTGPSILDLLA